MIFPFLNSPLHPSFVFSAKTASKSPPPAAPPPMIVVLYSIWLCEMNARCADEKTSIRLARLVCVLMRSV